MSCYMRHLHWLFDALDLEYDKPNRTKIDAALRQLVGLGDEATCFEVWAAVKALPAEVQESLPQHVREVIEPGAL